MLDVRGGAGLLNWHIYVPPSIIPAIIGYRGTRVKEIEAETGARLSIPKKTEYNSHDKNVQVVGSVSQKTDALRTLIEILCKDEDTSYVTIVLPSGCSPIVIGARGATVNDLEESYQVKIDVDDDYCTITGDVEKLLNCVERIYRIVESEHVPGQSVVEGRKDKNTWDESVYNEDSGWTLLVPSDIAPSIIGRSGATIQKMERVSGARLSVDRNEHKQFTGNKSITIYGSSSQKAQGLQTVLNHLGTSQSFMEQHGRMITFVVPSSCVSHIIGSHGKTIDWITEDSGAYISIDKKTEKEYTGIGVEGQSRNIISAAEWIYYYVETAAQW